jgi:hypothetical protein
MYGGRRRLAQPQRRGQVGVYEEPQVTGGRGERLAQAEGADGVHQHFRRAGVGAPDDKADGS